MFNPSEYRDENFNHISKKAGKTVLVLSKTLPDRKSMRLGYDQKYKKYKEKYQTLYDLLSRKGGGNCLSTVELVTEEQEAPAHTLLPFSPEWSRDIPTETPYPSFFMKLKTTFRNLTRQNHKSPRDKRIWRDAVKKITERYHDFMGTTRSIPVGTLLFHGSLDDQFDIFGPFIDSDRPVYFGIEANISLWYILEMAVREWQRRGLRSAKRYLRQTRPYGYLYVYRVTKEIPRENITFLPLLMENIRDKEKCFNSKTVCVHPQLAYRALSSIFLTGYNDLSIELTLHPSEYSDSIVFVEQYRVDTTDLLDNEKNPKYSSLHSISGQRETLDQSWEPTVDKD